MIINKINTLSMRKSSYNNNRQNTQNYMTSTNLMPLETDKCSFKGSPVDIDSAISTVIKNMSSPDFKEVSIPLINPNPGLITAFDKFYLRAKNIAEREMSFIEVQFANASGNGSQHIHTLNNNEISGIVNKGWYPKFLKEETVNKLIEASEKD